MSLCWLWVCEHFQLVFFATSFWIFMLSSSFYFNLTYSAPWETRQPDLLVTKHQGSQLQMESGKSRRDIHQHQIHPQVQTKVRFWHQKLYTDTRFAIIPFNMQLFHFNNHIDGTVKRKTVRTTQDSRIHATFLATLPFLHHMKFGWRHPISSALPLLMSSP